MKLHSIQGGSNSGQTIEEQLGIIRKMEELVRAGEVSSFGGAMVVRGENDAVRLFTFGPGSHTTNIGAVQRLLFDMTMECSKVVKTE